MHNESPSLSIAWQGEDTCRPVKRSEFGGLNETMDLDARVRRNLILEGAAAIQV